MEYLVVCVVALVASGLTFFSGFGLGTMLMPALALFFPVPVAVAATAVVHLANNVFKLFLVGRAADRSVLIRFAVPAVIASLLGAWLLSYAAALPALAAYPFMGKTHEITIIKLVIGLIIVAFSCLEFMPKFAGIAIDKKYMPLGGALSGFFGGLSGNQGALRSMFLIKAGLDKEAFIGTGVAAAVLVDMARLSVYGSGFFASHLTAVSGLRGLVAAAALSAFAGAFIGRALLRKTTLRTVQTIVGIMLICLGSALALGLI